MFVHRVAEGLEFTVDPALAKNRIERARVEEDVDVFREPPDQIPAF
jgi:hypothetical protein